MSKYIYFTFCHASVLVVFVKYAIKWRAAKAKSECKKKGTKWTERSAANSGSCGDDKEDPVSATRCMMHKVQLPSNAESSVAAIVGMMTTNQLIHN